MGRRRDPALEVVANPSSGGVREEATGRKGEKGEEEKGSRDFQSR